MANENERADEPRAAGTEGSPPTDDPVEDDDDAWEGFALDARVFRFGGGRHDD